MLLEPVVELFIVPDSFTGDIIGDLNTKRAQVLGMTPEDGFTTIKLGLRMPKCGDMPPTCAPSPALAGGLQCRCAAMKRFLPT